MNEGLTIEEITMVRAGEKIRAIKSLRERLGIDLRTGKDMVDAVALLVTSKPGDEIPCPKCHGTGRVPDPVKVHAAHLLALLRSIWQGANDEDQRGNATVILTADRLAEIGRVIEAAAGR